MYINQTNMVYRVKNEKLVAVKDSWGQLLKHSLLSPTDVRTESNVEGWDVAGKHVFVKRHNNST